jgi:hypothetical protein
MDIFGGAWVGYMDKLKTGMSVIGPEDTTVLLGDLSWSLDLANAKADFAWINEIPGKKIILKGNHDYWWSTAAKFYKFCQENGFEDQWILNNNCYEYDGWAICGTRGWFFEEDRGGTHDEKVFRRELIRLEFTGKHRWCCQRSLRNILFENCTIDNIARTGMLWGDPEEKVTCHYKNVKITAREGQADRPLLVASNVEALIFEDCTIEGFENPVILLGSEDDKVEFIRTQPVPLGKVSLEDALVLHKGGIAAIDQGKNLNFKLK